MLKIFIIIVNRIQSRQVIIGSKGRETPGTKFLKKFTWHGALKQLFYI